MWSTGFDVQFLVASFSCHVGHAIPLDSGEALVRALKGFRVEEFCSWQGGMTRCCKHNHASYSGSTQNLLQRMDKTLHDTTYTGVSQFQGFRCIESCWGLSIDSVCSSIAA